MVVTSPFISINVFTSMSFNLIPAYYVIVCILANKCSAVAKMGDRSATIDMGQKLGEVAVPLFGCGELGPHVTQCGLGRGLPSYQVAS